MSAKRVMANTRPEGSLGGGVAGRGGGVGDLGLVSLTRAAPSNVGRDGRGGGGGGGGGGFCPPLSLDVRRRKMSTSGLESAKSANEVMTVVVV